MAEHSVSTIIIADDSAAIRRILESKLRENPSIEVVAQAENGVQAIDLYKQHKPDFMLMDVFMPELDGVDTLQKIREYDADAKVFVYSSITQKKTEDVLEKVTNLGALDFYEKPENEEKLQIFIDGIVKKINEMTGHLNGSAGLSDLSKSKEAPIELRPYPKLAFIPKIIAIGSSTGGPQALMKVLKPLKENCHVPIVITQHMPASFTGILAGQIQEETGMETFEAKEGQVLEAGKIYLAPGDYHMRLIQNANKQMEIRLDQNPPVNFCRPAVDPMFESLVEICPYNILSVILTGMGSDGLEGARKIVEGGRSILIAQDKATSTVWGMPAAVAQAGLCHEVLPLELIPNKILTILGHQ